MGLSNGEITLIIQGARIVLPLAKRLVEYIVGEIREGRARVEGMSTEEALERLGEIRSESWCDLPAPDKE